MLQRTQFGSYVALDALRVGIIDDSAYFRKLLRTILTAYGIRQIFEASTQNEALEMVRFQRLDVLLLDWNLGTGGNGMSLIDTVRTHPDRQISTQAIVMVSAYSDKRQVLEAVRLGANDFIVKPVSAKLVYERLRRLTTTKIVYQRVGNRLVPVKPAQTKTGFDPTVVIPVSTREGSLTFL
ncbi:response regulator [Oryzibacter oryziterrae]|uniref:response regulator n=1 Tax=Oryzibacter oryziterrae TaxID=2766474 RepID=UPI001F003738|nr:response regulator [Oryzibacter oryziterrae]